MTALSPSAMQLDAARDPLAPVRRWLWLCAAMIFAMVVIGGITRLTESGLSITEWRPVTGAVPPLSEAEWQAAFARYQLIPEFREKNSAMTLAEFKTIFWWEYVHRLWGRLIGVVFAIPLLWFVVTGRVRGATPGSSRDSWRSAGCKARSGGGWSHQASSIAAMSARIASRSISASRW